MSRRSWERVDKENKIRRSAKAPHQIDYADDHLKLVRRGLEALRSQQATRFQPDDAEAYFSLGLTYGMLKRDQEALAAYQQAIRLKPGYAEAHYKLGWVYLILGDSGSALEEYKILQTLDQNLADALFRVIHQ